MNWMVWRQHRKQFVLVGVSVLVYVAIVGILGARHAHAYHTWLQTNRQGPILESVFEGTAVRYLPLASIVVPLILGMFWGAPLIAKEYETGTNKFVWTQGVTRRRWLSAKLLWMMGAAGLYGLVLSLVVGWSLRTENAVMFDRFEWVHFDVQGLMPVVYTVFAVALGAFIGAWRRRTVAAIGITLSVFVALQLAMGLYVRPAYMTPLKVINTYHDSYPQGGGESTTLSHTQTGIEPADNTAFWNLGFISGGSPEPCAPSAKICHTTDISGVKYQPANRFWPFQFIEAGIYTVLTATLVAGTFRLVLKRDVS